MTHSIKNKITALIDQSSDIAKQVRLENWDAVQLLTEQRQQALEMFFDKPVNTKDAGDVEKMIRAILHSDKELVGYIEIEKKKTFKTFANLKNNTKAKQTYQNVASLNYR